MKWMCRAFRPGRRRVAAGEGAGCVVVLIEGIAPGRGRETLLVLLTRYGGEAVWRYVCPATSVVRSGQEGPPEIPEPEGHQSSVCGEC
ncbi:hypothetical protein GCM10023160_03840 [Brachybacterium paraconglomeratum]